MNAAPVLCERPGCKVAETGACDLKHDPVELCPHFGKSAQTIQVASDAPPPKPQRTIPAIGIASGETMEMEDLEVFSRGHRIRTVSVIGEPRSGKTTLIAAIYASLCKGPIGDRDFVGSRTLVGFARRHHLALLNSERKSPKTPRTSRNDPTAFFHLALRPKTGGRHLISSSPTDRERHTKPRGRTPRSSRSSPNCVWQTGRASCSMRQS